MGANAPIFIPFFPLSANLQIWYNNLTFERRHFVSFWAKTNRQRRQNKEKIMAKQAKKTTTAKKPTAKATAKKSATAKPKTAKKSATAKPKTAKAKTAEKKTAVKKATAPKAKAAGKTTAIGKNVIAKFPTDKLKIATRRPPNNPEIPSSFLRALEETFATARDELEAFSAHLRSLDRKRLNGVGLKKLGFIGRALLLAAENPQFLPHWLPLSKFQDDNNYFLALRSIFDVTRQVQEILWNIIMEASDVLYTDALEYYAQVSDAAKRRVDPAETLKADLASFFKRGSYKSDEPTEKQLKRDFDALERGRKNGRLLIENVKPKMTGGKRKVIDETFKDTAQFKESEEGDFSE
jgi:hypothetical protein